MTGCRFCRGESGSQLHLDPHWRLTAGPARGLVLVVRRHVRALHELTDDEAAGLARWLVPACRALHRVSGSEVEYVAQLADGPADPHVHLHLVGRGPGEPRCRRGVGALAHLRDPDPVPAGEDSELLARVAIALHPSRS